MSFENVSVEDFQKLPTIICEVKWQNVPGGPWEDCPNKATWAGVGHDEEDCTTKDGSMLICDDCYQMAQFLGIGHCGHELFRDARRL